MITKERARQIYNLYSQIEKSNEIINTLEKCREQYEKDNEGIEIIRDNWNDQRTIELHVPQRFLNPGASSWSGSTIYQISVPDAILVLENHVVRLQKALDAENKKAMEED